MEIKPTCSEVHKEDSRLIVELSRQLKIAIEALKDFQLGHDHAPDLPHTRAMGDTYGWCDFCSTKVSWGPGLAEQALKEIEK